MNFKNLATLTALLCCMLALIWAFAPDILLSSWGVDFSHPVGLVGRRSAALFAGLGIMLFQTRVAEPSPARSAIVAGLIVANIALACLGIFELTTGHARLGILSAVVVEFALGASFIYVGRKQSPQ
ncbi:hypothetical protein [Undibacterium sp.]|jgi:hypothetical protein|uniref:hypothetical protein n=1 Tax=Undibacterium sp. TaxID=1914977 RepID=UPI002C8AA55F|nr:hypothetical protein [Undibacterium sp.]HTD04456.1 hypothetical protein [Undibacterium sp.]